MSGPVSLVPALDMCWMPDTGWGAPAPSICLSDRGCCPVLHSSHRSGGHPAKASAVFFYCHLIPNKEAERDCELFPSQWGIAAQCQADLKCRRFKAASKSGLRDGLTAHSRARTQNRLNQGCQLLPLPYLVKWALERLWERPEGIEGVWPNICKWEGKILAVNACLRTDSLRYRHNETRVIELKYVIPILLCYSHV